MREIKSIVIDGMGVHFVYHPEGLIAGYLSRRAMQLRREAHIFEMNRREKSLKRRIYRQSEFTWERFWSGDPPRLY